MKKLNIAIYSRKSKFSDKSESIENQINLCIEYCKSHFKEELNFIIYEDEGYSGGNINRPAFQRMNSNLIEEGINIVVCYKLDRISRDVSDFNILIKNLEKLGIDFICIKEQFDTTTPIGRAMMNISATFAQLERESIGERISDNLAELSKQGRFISSKAPFGFDKKKVTYIDKNSKEKKMNILITNNNEMKIVKLIFEKYLEFESINKVVSYFLTSKYTTRNKNKFTSTTIKRILTNEYYCTADKIAYDYFIENGAKIISNFKYWNGNNGVSIYKRINSKTKQFNEINKIIYSVGGHEGFIKSKTWIQVQNIIKNRKNLSKRGTKSSSLLSGILKCNICGAYMRPQSYQKNGSFYYVCEKKEISRRQLCNAKNIRGDIFDKEFIEKFQKALKTDVCEYKIFDLKQIDKYNLDNIQYYEQSLDENIVEINNIKQKISNLVLHMSNINKEISLGYIIEEIEHLNKNIENLNNENYILTTKLNDEKNKNTSLFTEDLKIIISDSLNKESNIDEKRKIIKNIVKYAYWDSEKVTVEFL